MKCLKCKEREPIEYEDIGEGKFCRSCLDEEMEIWKKEAGFEEEPKLKRVNLDLEFEKFKETYKGKDLEEDWRNYQEENDLIDESNDSEILENDSLIGSAYWGGKL